MASPELPEPGDGLGSAGPPREGRDRALSPSPCQPGDGWEHGSILKGGKNKQLQPFLRKPEERSRSGVPAALESPSGPSLPLLPGLSPDLGAAESGHRAGPAPGVPAALPASPSPDPPMEIAKDFQFCRERPPQGGSWASAPAFKLFWGVREGGRVFAL